MIDDMTQDVQYGKVSITKVDETPTTKAPRAGPTTEVTDHGAVRDALETMKPFIIGAVTMTVPIVSSLISWKLATGLDKGIVQLMLYVFGLGMMLVEMIAIFMVGEEVLGSPWSILNRGVGRLSPRRGIASAAARSIRSDWNRAVITTTSGHGGTNADSMVKKRSTMIKLPSGGAAIITHRHARPPLVILEATVEPFYRIEDNRGLGRIDAARIAAEVERQQIATLAGLIGLKGTVTGVRLSRVLGTMVTLDAALEEFSPWDNAGDENRQVIETRVLPGNITVTSLRPKAMTRPYELLVSAPEIGVLKLRPGPFGSTLGRRLKSRMAAAFGIDVPQRAVMPVFIGNARATRLAELARRALDEDPELTDALGNRLKPLVEEHLPLLIERHRASTRTADTDRIDEIDADLDRGLDAIARSLGQALDALANRRHDDLRTQVRFLESRNPNGQLASIADSVV